MILLKTLAFAQLLFGGIKPQDRWWHCQRQEHRWYPDSDSSPALGETNIISPGIRSCVRGSCIFQSCGLSCSSAGIRTKVTGRRCSTIKFWPDSTLEDWSFLLMETAAFAMMACNISDYCWNKFMEKQRWAPQDSRTCRTYLKPYW